MPYVSRKDFEDYVTVWKERDRLREENAQLRHDLFKMTKRMARWRQQAQQMGMENRGKDPQLAVDATERVRREEIEWAESILLGASEKA